MNRFVKTSRFFCGFFGRDPVAVLFYKSLCFVWQQGQAVRYNLLLRYTS